MKLRELAIGMILLSGLLAWSVWPGAAAAQSDENLYRIVILDNQPLSQAQRLRNMLQNWGYEDVLVEAQGNDVYRVLYGRFATEAAAQQAAVELRREGVTSRAIARTGEALATPSAAPMRDGLSNVVVGTYQDRPQARVMRTRLQRDGYGPISIEQVGRQFQVVLGPYNTNDAAVVLGDLRRQGYIYAKSEPLSEGRPAPRRPAVAPGAGDGSRSIDDIIQQLPADVTAGMTAEEREDLAREIVMQIGMRKGDDLYKEVLDLRKQISQIDDRIEGFIDEQVAKERAENELRSRMTSLYQEAENLIRAERWQEAILVLNQMKGLDPQNKLGQLAQIDRRIDYLDRKIAGIVEGGDILKQEEVDILLSEVNQLEEANTRVELQLLLGKLMDLRSRSEEHRQFAEQKISEVRARLQRIEQEQQAQTTGVASQQLFYIIVGMSVGFGFLLLLLIIVWARGRAEQKRLMKKVQEITSIRPMRELEGGAGAAGMIGSGDGGGGDEDIFAPKQRQVAQDESKQGAVTGAAAAGAAAAHNTDEDSLFGSKPASSADEEDVFGSPQPAAPSAPESGAGDDLGLDDLFGGDDEPSAPPTREEPVPPTHAQTAGPTQESSPEVDDVFGNLFGDEEQTSTEAEPRPAPAPAATEDDGDANAGHASSISFDDLLSMSDEQQRTGDNGGAPGQAATESEARQPASPGAAEDDSMFDIFQNVGGGAVEPASEPAPQPAVEQGGSGSPFDDLLRTDEAPAGSATTPGETDSGADDTEIPSISLSDMGPGETAPSPAISDSDSPENDATVVPLNMPAMGGQETMPNQVPLSGAGVELDFENDAVGRQPAGWHGSYDYATLTVQNESPVRGSHQYLCFEKPEGAGKAHYYFQFPEVGGVVGIEFDLRCNDKNKFLLGFYVEKDANFQPSINTKILRSESQTTPSIHLQGESAPYLLGSWCHIKYVVDLNEGKLNGYIDATHVVVDLPLQQNPGSLNTLSIRDNINTTGVLLLDNVKVYPTG